MCIHSYNVPCHHFQMMINDILYSSAMCLTFIVFIMVLPFSFFFFILSYVVIQVQKDDLVPDLLVLPPSSDLHDHCLIIDGSIFMQGKASSMVAAALAPKPGWELPETKLSTLQLSWKGKEKASRVS